MSYVLTPLKKTQFDELFSPKAIKVIQYKGDIDNEEKIERKARGIYGQ